VELQAARGDMSLELPIAAAPVRPDLDLAEPVLGNYFVAAYPPFSAWTPAQARALTDALSLPPSAAPLGVYVHLPFCQKKCDYCSDAPSLPISGLSLARRRHDWLGRSLVWARSVGCVNWPTSIAKHVAMVG
jgi:hypothetical protein